MERPLHRDHLISIPLHLLFCILSGKFQCPFIGLCPAVTEKDLIRKGMLAEKRGELDLGLNVIEVGNVDQFLCLILNCPDHPGVAMAQIANGKACHKIKIFLSLRIPDPCSFSPDRQDGKTGIGTGNILFRQTHQRLRIHSHSVKRKYKIRISNFILS